MAPGRRIPLAVGVVLLTLWVTGCSGDQDRGAAGLSGDGGAAGESSQRSEAARARPGSSSAFALGPASQTSSAALPSVGATIIKTARVEIAVGRDGVQDAIQDATTTAGDFGGFVLSTSVDEDRFRSGTVVLRVPAASFTDALAEVEDLGDVEEESVRGQDVGQELVDLEARLRNWRAQEAVLLGLMDRAETISQTIRVQNQLQGVQLEIERIRGRLRFLEDQTALSTITASFTASGVPAAGKPSTIERAVQQAVDLALGVVAALIVSLGIIIPGGILIMMALLIYKQVRPRFP